MALTALRPSGPAGGLSIPTTVGLAVAAAALAVGAVAATPSNPILPVAVIGVVFAVALAIMRPLVMVWLGVVVIPLEGYFPGLVGPSQALLGLSAVGWLVGWGTTSPLTIPRHPALVAYAVLVIANAAGLLFAPEPLVVARQVITWGTLLVVAAAIAHSATRKGVLWILFAYAVCGGLAGAVAIVNPQPLTGVVFQGGDVLRATGGLGSPNALGMLLVMAIPIQIVFALTATPLVRLVGAGGATLAMVGMGLSVSRGAFLGLGAALVVLALWAPFRKLALLALPLVLVLAMIGSNPASPVFDGSRVVERLTEVQQTGANNPRFILWEAAPGMIADRPIFGIGGLEYGYYAPEYELVTNEGIPNHAHNLLLTIVIESGLLGLAGLLGIFVAVGVALRRVISRLDGLARGMGFALAAAFTGFFVTGVVDYALGAAPIAAAFFVLVGCTVALSRSIPAPEAEADGAAEPPDAEIAASRPPAVAVGAVH